MHVKKEENDAAEALVAMKSNRPKRGYVMDDLNLQDRRPYRKYLLPAYYEFIMATKDPFDTHSDGVLPALTRLFQFLYPHDKRIITSDCPLKVLVMSWLIYQKMIINAHNF